MKEYICKEVPTEYGGYLEIEIELIRCKDCIHYHGYICDRLYGLQDAFTLQDYDYCSRAELKDTTEEVRKQLNEWEQRREMDRKK
jgi:hypothetical protein